MLSACGVNGLFQGVSCSSCSEFSLRPCETRYRATSGNRIRASEEDCFQGSRWSDLHEDDRLAGTCWTCRE